MNQRLTKLKAYLRKKKIDTFLASSVANIAYLTGFSNFSKEERDAYLLLTKDQQYLFTDSRYLEAVKKVVKNFKIIKISSSNRFYKQLGKILKKEKIKRLGFEKDNLTVGELEKIKSWADPSTFLIPTENLIENLRVIKEPEEILNIERACQLGDRTFEFILGKIKPDMTEKELAAELEFFIKKQGADISFLPIIAFGANSSIPHHQTNHKPLAINDKLILLDFGVKLNNYCSDMSRVVFFGKATAEQKRIYKTVLQAQKRAIEYLSQRKTPLKAKDVDRVARNHIINAGFATILHSLGHGVGLEVHELPRLSPKSKDILKPGMVFSIEPGIYLPGNFGIRIEDLVTLTPSGLQILTRSPKGIIEL